MREKMCSDKERRMRKDDSKEREERKMGHTNGGLRETEAMRVGLM